MSQDTSFDYSLDARQLAMLEAMGVSGLAAFMKVAQEPVITSSKSAVAPVLEQKTPIANENITKFAIENVVSPVSTPAPVPIKVRRADDVEAMGWRDLMGAVRTCRSCNLCTARTQTVFGTGATSDNEHLAPQVDWLIVGEAPGEQEDLQGLPFVGPAGQLLDNMLLAMRVGKEGRGLSREHTVFITNVLKCRPPANRNPSPEEVALCEPFLARQIDLLKPKIIVAMGKFAIASLTGSGEPVGKLRGTVHRLKHLRYQAPVIVTYHPAYLLRNLPAKAQAWQDLLLAVRTYKSLAMSAHT